MNWLHYLLEANIYLGVFYIAYCLFLNKETHYLLNRIYLVSSCIIAFILPLMQIGLLKAPVAPPAPMMPTAFMYVPTSVTPIAMAPIADQPFNWQDGLWYIYIAGAVIFLLLFIIKLFSLVKLVIGKPVLKHHTYNLIYIDESQTAFSFFNYLFIGKHATDENIIKRHELVHIRQKHSADIVFLELLKIISWFNPLIYLVQNSLKTVHEYIADEQSVDSPNDALTYSSFLVSNAYGLSGPSITHSFFTYNLLKKRIIMLNQQRSGNLARLKYLVAVPIGAVLLCASTLGFSKTYGWIDLAPRESDKTTLTAPSPTAIKSTYAGLMKYIKNNMRYTASDGRNPTQVFADITITPNHKISDVKASKWVNTTTKSSLQPKVLELISSYPGLINDKPGKYIIVAMLNLDGEENIGESRKLPGYAGEIVLNIPQAPPPPPINKAGQNQHQKPKVDQVKFPIVLVPAGFKPKKTYVNDKGYKIEEGIGRTKTNFTYYVVTISDPSGKDLTVANDGDHKHFVAYKGMSGTEKTAYSLYGYKFPDVKVSRFIGPPQTKMDQIRFPPPIALVPVGFKPEKSYLNEKGYKIEEGGGSGKNGRTWYLVIITDPSGKKIKYNNLDVKQIVVYKGMTNPSEDDLYKIFGYKFPDINVSAFPIEPPKPKTDVIRFPPPIVKPDKANAPKPKVDMVRFPPPSVLSDKAVGIIPKDFTRYLMKNIRYPKQAKNNDITGPVVAQFTIDNDHNLISPTIVKGLGYGCDDEVIRVLNSYKEKLPGNPGNYVIIVEMYLDNVDGTSKKTTPIDESIKKAPNLLGDIVVVGYGSH